jgi:UDP-N-acetylmuramate dehydrogenase
MFLMAEKISNPIGTPQKMVLDRDAVSWLSSHFGSNVKFNEPMANHTSLRVGGPAEAYVVPENIESLKALIKWLWQKKLPYLIIGDGTNLLVKDNGITGIVIVLTKCLKTIAQTDTQADRVFVTAMAGARMRTLCRFAIERGLKGTNFAMGIPGTVGGAIMMNAGTSLGSVESVLESIKVLLPTGHSLRIKKEKLNFSYRKLSWNEAQIDIGLGQPIVLDGCFCLHPADPEKLKKEAQEILKARQKRHPYDVPSAGCFYKNPASDKTAGELIDLAGLKGKSIGGAEISSKHANFIINRQNASAADFLALMALVEETVLKMFNINLEREVKIVGS